MEKIAGDWQYPSDRIVCFRDEVTVRSSAMRTSLTAGCEAPLGERLPHTHKEDLGSSSVCHKPGYKGRYLRSRGKRLRNSRSYLAT